MNCVENRYLVSPEEKFVACYSNQHGIDSLFILVHWEKATIRKGILDNVDKIL